MSNLDDVELLEEGINRLISFIKERGDLTNEEKVSLSRVGFVLSHMKDKFKEANEFDVVIDWDQFKPKDDDVPWIGM